MKISLGLSCIVILFALSVSTADDSNNASTVTKPRTKREPGAVVRINSHLRPKKSYGPTPRSKYGGESHGYVPHGGYGGVKSGPPKRKYGPGKRRPSKPGYGQKPKYGPSNHHGLKNSYRPPKFDTYYGPQSDEEDFGFGEPPSGFGDHHQSFGEPPSSSFFQNGDTFSGSDSSSFSSSFDDPASEYEGTSFGSYKKYRRPSSPKKPYDFTESFKTGLEDGDAFDNYGYSSGTPYAYETRYETSTKSKRPKHKTPVKHYGKDTFTSSSFSKPKRREPPYDLLDNYEAQGTGYPDETIPPSDYFGAPISHHNPSSLDSYIDDIEMDNYRDQELYRRPHSEVVVKERPKKKAKVVKVIKVRNIKRKPKPRNTDEGQIIVGGHYSESTRGSRDPYDMYDSSYAGSRNTYTAVAPDTNYINYKAANMGFSPQNVNDVFTANKRLQAGYSIQLGDKEADQGHMGTIVAQTPNYLYNKERDHASEVKISKSISHDYYAGTVPDSFYTPTDSPMRHYSSDGDNVLPPNYYDFSNTGLSEKTSQKFRDIASISLQNEDGKSDPRLNYDNNIKNHRT